MYRLLRGQGSKGGQGNEGDWGNCQGGKSHRNLNAYEGLENTEMEGRYLVVNGVPGGLVFQIEINGGT